MDYKESVEKIEKRGSFLSYRTDVKVLDCTIRDGGLVNNFDFHDDFVRNLYTTCTEAGVDYMEFGYKSSKKIFAPSKFGIWKFCNEDDIRRIVDENNSPLKLSVMADTGKTDYHEDILPKQQSAIDMIRVATYIHQIPSALDIIKDAHDKGYETCVNLMSISLVSESELDDALEMLSRSEAECIYLVDSFGALYSEQIRALTRKYLQVAEQTGKTIGIHAHNNQQLAYANTIEALVMGASYLDATVAGLGRGAGNCPLELLLGFLRNPKYNIRPVIKFIQENIPALQEKGVAWGFNIPYMLTGQFNLHPKIAIDYLDSKDKNDYLSFFDKLMNED
jgi:4-hydroxy 2-oxovalerate aldolase